MHAKIIDNQIAEYPIVNLRQYLPNTSLPSNLLDDSILPEGYVYVHSKAPDAYNPATHKPVQSTTPTFNGTRWELVYSIVELTAQELSQKVLALKTSVVEQVQQRLDEFAQTRNYDGIMSACTYATSSFPKFSAEGQYCVDARDNTWVALLSILGEIEAGTRPIPTCYEDIETDLPTLTWPLQ